MKFFVAGVPVPKGSAKAFVVKGRAVVTQDNAAKQKPWASSITYTARENGAVMIYGPVALHVDFTLPRLKGHMGSGKNAGKVKESAPVWHTSKPDLDKLIRCVKDALTGVCWRDDSQVVMVTAHKTYGDTPGAQITVGTTI